MRTPASVGAGGRGQEAAPAGGAVAAEPGVPGGNVRPGLLRASLRPGGPGAGRLPDQLAHSCAGVSEQRGEKWLYVSVCLSLIPMISRVDPGPGLSDHSVAAAAQLRLAPPAQLAAEPLLHLDLPDRLGPVLLRDGARLLAGLVPLRPGEPPAPVPPQGSLPASADAGGGRGAAAGAGGETPLQGHSPPLRLLLRRPQE